MSNRVVVVTGAASGIGFATAERFRALGDTVFGLDIATSVPEGVTFVKCDVADKDAVDAAVATCAEAGGIDVLANVAGIVQFGRFETVTEEVFDRIQAVDVRGPFFLIQAALPHLRASRGCVVNVSSVAGRIPQPYAAAYAVAKGGLTQLTRSLALELSPDGIRVNAVCPGTVDTPLVARVAETYPADLDPRVSDRLLAMLPGGASTPDEIASTIVYLASGDARMMTGAVVAHDGGMS
ncbi:SDR family oxidoreductase [Nocardioides sp. SOB44]|uniref:SDR family oxidoreductase n=1 Tax=Nocardioides cremeus TaxID=3058044 RepID=A0ABT8TR22_9ACTN|nr:SDR family oxidoreductase [Nocardioides cremeus]MDO3396402.1 SDR family oxidoreductase [Nocardioides cremeus]